MKKILFFANIPTDNPNSIGGATVLANNILQFISKEKKIEVTHQQIRNNWNRYGQIIDYFIWIFKAPFIFRKYNIISFHTTHDFHLTIAPIIWVWAKILNKKIIYHFFGGIFYDKYEKSFFLHRLIMKKTFLSSNTVFMETKMMVKRFKNEGVKNCIWFPNSRSPSNYRVDEIYTKRFVFISRVTPSKGIEEIIKASSKLSKDYLIDIYGPIDKNYYTEADFNKYNINYKGLIKSDLVESVLLKYNVLLLPTHHDGEGYPGIIIESLSIGMPVITTNWRSIPEIINNRNGILIQPNNYSELVIAMKHFSQLNYGSYKNKASKSFQMFSSDFVFKKILQSYLN